MACTNSTFQTTTCTPVGFIVNGTVGSSVLQDINCSPFNCSLSPDQVTLCRLGLLIAILNQIPGAAFNPTEVQTNAIAYLGLTDDQKTMVKLELLGLLAGCGC